MFFVAPYLSEHRDCDLQPVLGSFIVVDPVSCNVHRGFYSVNFRFVVQQAWLHFNGAGIRMNCKIVN